MMKNPNSITVGARTCGIGLFRREYNTVTGDRPIYATPAYYALVLERNHSGNKLYSSYIECGQYSINRNIKGLPWYENVPWLDVVAIGTDDTLFISVINRHPGKYFKTVIDPGYDIKKGRLCNVYYIWSPDYTDANTADEPEKVIVKETLWEFDSLYSFHPHSVTVLAIPINDVPFTDSSFSFRAYPNPFDGILIIIISVLTKFESNVAIYDIFGKKVYSDIIPQGLNELSIYDFPGGMGIYILEIKNTYGVFRKKLIRR